MVEMYEEVAIGDCDYDRCASDAIEGAISLAGDEGFIRKWPGNAAGTDAVDGSEGDQGNGPADKGIIV
jgi:hypothetical protein